MYFDSVKLQCCLEDEDDVGSQESCPLSVCLNIE